MTDRVRWTDERLDDRFASIDTALNVRVRAMAEDVAECKTGIRDLTATMTATSNALATRELKAAEAKLKEREQLHRERVSDRRWLVGTVLAAMSLMIAAISVLAATGVFS